MAAKLLSPQVVYGQTQGLVPVMPMVKAYAGVPPATLQGVLGQVVTNSLSAGDVYMLTGVIAGLSQWTPIAGGAGNFNTLTVVDDITSTLGSIRATTGVVQGNSILSDGNVYSAGDFGVGVAARTAFTNVVNTTQGAGALTLRSTNGNAGTNAGFMKFYVGTTIAYVPYYTNIAP